MSKSSNTSLLGWWMEAITVLPSLARPRSVCVTKNADELQASKHTHTYKNADTTTSDSEEEEAGRSPVEAAGGLVEEEEARAHE